LENPRLLIAERNIWGTKSESPLPPG
jgi:hypothetical protein